MMPRAAWRWGLLAGVCLPMLVALTGVVGPYGRDRGDVWFPLFPCVVLALMGALVGRSVRTRPPSPRPE